MSPNSDNSNDNNNNSNNNNNNDNNNNYYYYIYIYIYICSILCELSCSLLSALKYESVIPMSVKKQSSGEEDTVSFQNFMLVFAA